MCSPAPVCVSVCECVCVWECAHVSSDPAKCRECTQLVKESKPTHLSTCADNGPRLCAYIYTLINQLGPLISHSGNLMTSHSMVSYTREGGESRQSHTYKYCAHMQTYRVLDTVHSLQYTLLKDIERNLHNIICDGKCFAKTNKWANTFISISTT